MVATRAQPRPQRTAVGRQRADRIITFIELLTVPSGIGQGKQFKLMPWQKRFLRDIYEPSYRDGRRAVRRAILSVARKNGKTALIAGLVLAHLVGPQQIVNGEIYSAANDRDQASIVYKFCKQLVEREPSLRKCIQVIPSTKTMIGLNTGSVYRAISAEAGTKHGYLPSLVIYDELAQAKSRELYDVLDTSFGARDQPLYIVISTQSNDPEHILSKLIDDGISGLDPSIICHLYAADDECPLDDEIQWKKANPALGVFRNRADLETQIYKAMRLPAEEPKVRNLLLNQRVAPIATLISRAEWMACGTDELVEFKDGEEVYLGLDLSASLDLTALVVVSASDPARVQPYFWKPADTLREHAERDFGVGNQRYQEWVTAGKMSACPGSSVDPEIVARKIGELHMRFKVKGLAYDRWRMDVLLREFDDIGLAAYRDRSSDSQAVDYPRESREAGIRCVPWGQGFKDMAPAIDAFLQAIADRKLLHPNNPVLTWNIANAVATMDPAGNRKLDKGKARFRIDGAVALAMAMGLRARDREQFKPIDIEALIA
jgi:phage terminase large subunit-like protein